MHSVLGLNYFVFCILVLVIVLFFTMNVRDEGFNNLINKMVNKEHFGMSPGTMDQLSSTRVEMFENIKDDSTKVHIDMNRKPDQELKDMIQSTLLKKGLKDMTGSGENVEAYREDNPVFSKLYENLNYIK